MCRRIRHFTCLTILISYMSDLKKLSVSVPVTSTRRWALWGARGDLHISNLVSNMLNKDRGAGQLVKNTSGGNG